MKINVGDETFLVHFNTYSFESSYEIESAKKKLTGIKCIVRVMDGDVKSFVSSGDVKQNAHDKCNLVFARKIAFTKAIEIFPKEDREIFWEEYKKEVRYK